MDVLVTGGTGFVGTALCRDLADRGHAVTALARDPSSAALPPGVDGAMGDVTAYDSIEDAFAGQDAVVNLVALSPLFRPRGGPAMHDEVHLRGTENVVRAAEAHDLDRVVQMSALGADPDAPTAYLRAKGRAEAVVREADLDWVLLRPSVIFGDGDEFVSFVRTVTPPVVAPLPGGGRTRFQPIWVDDVAGILAAAVEDDAHVGHAYEVGGPEVLTLADVAELVRPSASVVSVPMAVVGGVLSAAGAVPGVPFGRDQYRSLGLDNVPAHNDVDAFGLAESDLRSLRAYLDRR